MIIPLSKDYRVRGTEQCWQLEKAIVRKGKRDWAAFKYFSDLGKAVSEACRREIRLHSAATLTDAIEAIDKIAARYNKLLDDALNDVESRRVA